MNVAIYDAAYDQSMEDVISTIMDAVPSPWQDKKVLIKPNMLAPHDPEQGVTTHPSIVRAVVDYLRGQGAEVMVGDNPGLGGYGISRETARVCGILSAAGDCFINLARHPVKYMVSSRYFDHVMVAGDVLDADFVVNLPKLKTHGLTYITGAVKNTYGYVVGGDKMRVHSCAKTPREFAEALVDIYQIRPPELTIMDAVVAMEGNGPNNGTLRSLGKVIAGTNAIAVDTVAVHLIGQNATTIPHLEIAGRRGLGETDIKRIAISGAFEPVADFRLPTTFAPGLMGVVFNRFLSRWINCVPDVENSVCQMCGICIDHCPVGAMRMHNGYPKADEEHCIHCYCCQELCPQGAIKLSGRMMRFLRRTYVRR